VKIAMWWSFPGRPSLSQVY